jgi:MOSC domain-containing protein YiiM
LGRGRRRAPAGGPDVDWWAAELGRELPPGRFGENLRTAGVDLTGAVLGERWRVGTALLEVTAPRIPCAAFERFWGVPQLVERFTAPGASGAYLRVLESGDVRAGDAVEVVHRPGHGITAGLAFRALTTEQRRLPELAPALAHLPVKDQPKIAAKIATRTGAVG